MNRSRRRWLFWVGLVASALLANAWARWHALQVLETLARAAGGSLRYESADGWFGTMLVRACALELSPGFELEAPVTELGYWQGQAKPYAPQLDVALREPLNVVYGDLEKLGEGPSGFGEARVDWQDRSVGHVAASGLRGEANETGYTFSARSLRVGATEFSDVAFTLSKPQSVVQARLGPDRGDQRALELAFVPSPGEGWEWTLNVPSQPFPEFAQRTGIALDPDFAQAKLAAVGSFVIPESDRAFSRANLRVVIDGWRRPAWPDSAALTGASGALAIRLAPAPGTVWNAPSVEVEAGLFSLQGSGELALGPAARLRWHASGRRRCSELEQNLAPSVYREQVRAYLGQNGAHDESIELALTALVSIGAKPELRFRWHLSAACGIAEQRDD
ncbi:MAG: hypothetical protein QM756_09720 [Polyangiaceae bacterium]